MLRTILNGNLEFIDLLFLMISYAVIILIALPVHELAHAFVADRLGDTTPRWHGRLSLNPFAHLDLMGTIMIAVVGIGYAKPVPVNTRNFKNPRVGMVLTSLAGPLSNLLMAILAVGLFRVLVLVMGGGLAVYGDAIYMATDSDTTFTILEYAYFILINVFASINIGLAVFNLLPIPPLDGSRLLWLILPDRIVYRIEAYSQYITMGVLLLLFVGVFDTPLYWLRHGVGFLVCGIFGLPNLF